MYFTRILLDLKFDEVPILNLIVEKKMLNFLSMYSTEKCYSAFITDICLWLMTEIILFTLKGMPKKFQIVYIFETQQVEESIFIFFFLFFVISWVSGQ